MTSRSPSESLILRNKTHTGPIRGLDFNPIQPNLFSSGAVNGEVSTRLWHLYRHYGGDTRQYPTARICREHLLDQIHELLE